MEKAVSTYLDAGYPCLYIPTVEQERAFDEVIRNLTEANLIDKLSLYIWKCSVGLYPYQSEDPDSDRIAGDIADALRNILKGVDGAPARDHLHVFFNVKDFLQNPMVRQLFRDTAYALRTRSSHMICIGAQMDIPEDLDDMITVIDFNLPSKAEIKKRFSSVVNKYTSALGLDISEEKLERAAQEALGLSMLKAENSVAISLIESRDLDIEVLRAEKVGTIRQNGVLALVQHGENIDTIGGMGNVIPHIQKRRKYYEDIDRAVKFGLGAPKGIMTVGLAGTGKSLLSKVAASILGLPLYRFNVGALFQGVVGASESKTRSTLKLLERVAPCAVEFDEFEKMFTGLESSGKTDSGVTSRVIQTILTWMQECKAPIFKSATCNTIRGLDSALFRRGRWDAIFGVDVPVYEERKTIFDIHLTKRGRDAAKFDLDAMADVSKDWVGAEIESAVEDALYNAYSEDRDVTTQDIIDVAATLVPIAKTDKEAIEDFRVWVTNRATPASSMARQPAVSRNRKGKPKTSGRTLRLN